MLDTSSPDFDLDYLDYYRNKRSNKKAKRKPKSMNSSMQLLECFPQTENQAIAFNEYRNGKNLLLHGLAGTGKTFISLYLALEELFNSDTLENITICRSVVPSRDIGFLPGNQKEKSKVYETPYYGIFQELFGRGDAYEIMKNKGIVDFMITSYIRGTTLNNSIILVDECQNMTGMELHSIITRLGQNSKIVFCGDFRQNDLPGKQSGFVEFMQVLHLMPSVAKIEFYVDDTVRSGLVKEYIIARDKLNLS